MGARADFYVGRGTEAEWLGSIGSDGYPSDISPRVLAAVTEPEYRAAVQEFLDACGEATFPKDGWPWPWNDSRGSDYAYAWADGHTWRSEFGRPWILADQEPPDYSEQPRTTIFPDMTSRQQVTLGPRSGLILIRG